MGSCWVVVGQFMTNDWLEAAKQLKLSDKVQKTVATVSSKLHCRVGLGWRLRCDSLCLLMLQVVAKHRGWDVLEHLCGSMLLVELKPLFDVMIENDRKKTFEAANAYALTVPWPRR